MRTFRAFDATKDKPFFILVLLIISQILLAYVISKFNIPDNVLSHLMYIPIICIAYFFDYKIGILSGVIAELLIDIFASQNLTLANSERLFVSFFRTILFCSTGLAVGLVKQQGSEFSQRLKGQIIHPFTQIPYWGSIEFELGSLTEARNIVHFRFFLIEISNQNEIMATFGQNYVNKINTIIIEKIRAKYRDGKLFLVNLNTFALVLPEIHQDVDELIHLFEQSILVNGILIYCEITIGEASYPEFGQNSDEILKNGFTALNEARLHQKPYQQYYMQLSNPEIPILLGQFQNAIKNNEIGFHYQPIVSKTRDVAGLEALVRWNHPVKGIIPPDQFIPNLEFTRLTNMLTYYSLEYNLVNMVQLYYEGFNLDISINISITDLFQVDFAEKVISILNRYKFPAHHLALEITERGFLNNDSECRRNLESLYENGIKLSIDDFGVGFTSISNFRNAGIYSIKIDKSFVKDIQINPSNQAILEGIISIAKASNIEVIAEGIEKKEEKDKLLEMGVDCLQGYFLSKPQNFNNIHEWLLNYSSQKDKREN